MSPFFEIRLILLILTCEHVTRAWLLQTCTRYSGKTYICKTETARELLVVRGSQSDMCYYLWTKAVSLTSTGISLHLVACNRSPTTSLIWRTPGGVLFVTKRICYVGHKTRLSFLSSQLVAVPCRLCTMACSRGSSQWNY